jgi:hypothetical protein
MTDEILGLVVALPDVCRACGATNAIAGESKGPHRASLRCEECTMHRGWLGSTTHAFLVEVVVKFGRPDRPIAIKRGNDAFQHGKGVGLISAHSFRASSPNTAAQPTNDRAPPAIAEDTEAESNSDGDEKCPWD